MSTSFRRHSTININQTYYVKPQSQQRIKRRYFIQPSPTQTKFQLNNRKKQLINEAKYTEVERQNRILLTKITGVSGKTRRQMASEMKFRPKKSLNSTYQKKVWSQIEIDNAKILQRIINQKSHYCYGKKSQKIIKRKNIRKVPNIQSSQNQNSSTQRPVVLQKVMNLNGNILFVQILLTPHSLIIQAKSQNEQSKIINIPKQQALDFIASECNSSIENLFDCLSFNKGTLYLIGNDQQQYLQKNKCWQQQNQEQYEQNVYQKKYPTQKKQKTQNQQQNVMELGVQISSNLPIINIDDEKAFIQLDSEHYILNERKGGKEC